MVTSSVKNGASVILCSKATGDRQFIRKNPPVFTGVLVEEDPKNFVDEREKIFCVMYATNIERVVFASYQLKDVSY